jgi:hypothetical protein
MRPSPHVAGACEIEVADFQINISTSTTKCENARLRFSLVMPKRRSTRAPGVFQDNDLGCHGFGAAVSLPRSRNFPPAAGLATPSARFFRLETLEIARCAMPRVRTACTLIAACFLLLTSRRITVDIRVDGEERLLCVSSV